MGGSKTKSVRGGCRRSFEATRLTARPKPSPTRSMKEPTSPALRLVSPSHDACPLRNDRARERLDRCRPWYRHTNAEGYNKAHCRRCGVPTSLRGLLHERSETQLDEPRRLIRRRLPNDHSFVAAQFERPSSSSTHRFLVYRRAAIDAQSREFESSGCTLFRRTFPSPFSAAKGRR